MVNENCDVKLYVVCQQTGCKRVPTTQYFLHFLFRDIGKLSALNVSSKLIFSSKMICPIHLYYLCTEINSVISIAVNKQRCICKKM